MAKKKSKKQTLKNGRIRTKLTMLKASGIPMWPYEWKTKLPEMLLIAGLLEKQNVIEVVSVFDRLKNLVTEKTKNANELGFVGGVSEVAKLVKKVRETKRDEIQAILRQIFCGANLSLLKVYEIPEKKIISDLLGNLGEATQVDYINVMRATGAALHGDFGRATRAKLVQLMLWDPDGSKFHTDIYKLGGLLEKKSDDILKEAACSNIRATWACTQGSEDEDITPWVKTFWQFGLDKTPCLCKNPKKGRDKIRLSSELKSIIRKIDRLWKTIVALNPKHNHLFVSDVAMGLTCRIWRFMHHIVEASGTGNGEIAEMAARCQWDSVITFEWLIERNDPRLFLQYRNYSAGKSKATLERLRKETETYGGKELKERVEPTLIEEIEEGIGIWEQLVNEERGGWAKEGTYEMAKDLSMLHEYEIYFRRLSDIVHGTWRSLERYHMRQCQNPLHAGHYVPWTGATHDAGVSIVHFGIKMAIRAMHVLVEYMGSAANPEWKIRLEKIEAKASIIAKKDLDVI